MAGDRHQVIIVGGGPVGLALAVEFGQRGIPTAIIERHSAPQRIPKGQGLTARTLEHFHIVSDTWSGDRRAYESRFVLVRPDQYGAWKGDTEPNELEAVLRTAAGVA